MTDDGSGVAMRTRLRWLCVALIAFLVAVGFAGLGQRHAGLGGAQVAAGPSLSIPASGDDDTMKHPGAGIPDLVRGATAGSNCPLGAVLAPDQPCASGSVSWVAWTCHSPQSTGRSDSGVARAPPVVL